MTNTNLTAIGLSENESKIYTTLLKLGFATVVQIAKESGFHRSNIYDIIEKLREKGLITVQKEGKTTKYKTSDLENLYSFIQEKQVALDNLMPNLKSLEKQTPEEIDVELFKGEKGMRFALRDIIRERKDTYTFTAKGQLRKNLPDFAEQFMRDQKRFKIKYFGLYTSAKNLPAYFTEIKIIPKELGNPVATNIYGDKVLITIWEPSMIAILIKSKFVAESYKKHFDLIWKIAKPIKKS